VTTAALDGFAAKEDEARRMAYLALTWLTWPTTPTSLATGTPAA
jgi:hypothetical protein